MKSISGVNGVGIVQGKQKRMKEDLKDFHPALNGEWLLTMMYVYAWKKSTDSHSSSKLSDK